MSQISRSDADFDVTTTEPVETMDGGTFLGATIGAGVDLKLAPNAIIRAEVVYDVFGSETYGDCVVDFSAVTARVAAIFQF